MLMLAPLFLLGLAAVAVPLLVHLVQREKRDPMAFPSLMFLERTRAPFTSRRNLRDPLLFLLRALAVVALALAFARPVFGRRNAAGGADVRRRDVVVLVDRSFSMRADTRWQRARAAVDSIIRRLGTGDRVTLVAFDRRAQVLTAMTSDVTVLQSALASLTPTDESTRLAPAIAIAQQRLVASDAPRKAVVVVSDFQRTAWDLTDESRMAAGTEIAAVDVGNGGTIADRAVRSVTVLRDRTPGPARVIVSALVSNLGAATRGVKATLEVSGRAVDTRTVDLPRDGGATVTFTGVPVPPDAAPARVLLDADAIAGDDAFHFLLQQSPSLPVLVVEGRGAPFLTRALSIGEAPRFEVTTRAARSVQAADLARTRLVVLADGALPPALGAVRLERFVRDGGGLIVALGDEVSTRGWDGAGNVLIPGAIRAATDRLGASGAVLGSLDHQHPALAELAGPLAGDLTSARFYKYRAIDTTAGVLARFDDGTAALTEHTVGRGRVLTFGSSLDGLWNDLPRQPAFLPLVQELARYGAAWREAPRAFEIGASILPADLAGASGVGVSRWVATAPSGARTSVGGDGNPRALELTEAGVHAVRPGGTPGARPILVAANIAPAELDWATFDVLRLTSALTGAGNAAATGVAQQEETLADREARQSTWWYLLAGTVLLLIAESIVARRAVTQATSAV